MKKRKRKYRNQRQIERNSKDRETGTARLTDSQTEEKYRHLNRDTSDRGGRKTGKGCFFLNIFRFYFISLLL